MPFFEIPRELRDIVVDEALMFDDEYPLEANSFNGNKRIFLQPLLSLVNRQLRAETLPAYYRKKTSRRKDLNIEDEA